MRFNLTKLNLLNSLKPTILLTITISTLSIAGCASSSKRLDTRDWQQATRQVMRKYSPYVNSELETYFENAHVHYPPRQIALLTFKKEREMELWARDHGHYHFIKRYHLTASSGGPGPKLHSRDGQIPEGIYHITLLNPFSSWHLSMKLDYPNAFDRYHATKDHRHNLGGDIFIHGNHLSVGCLAIGDKSINELFVLADEVGRRNIKVIIAPNDLRYEKPLMRKGEPKWVPQLYARIKQQLAPFHQYS